VRDANQLHKCALIEFDKAVRLAPNHAIAYVQKCYAEYRLALMTGDQSRLERVIRDFEQAIEKFPDCVECYSLMAQVLADQQQFPQAQLFYEKAMKLAPSNPSLLVHQAIMMLQWRGDIELAVTLLNRAIDVDPKCELAYETLGGTAPDAELDRKKKSAELGEQLSPLKEANNYKTEGNNCYRNGKYDEAISFYDKAIDKCPLEHRTDLAIFYQNRAASYEMLKKWNKVKEDCSLSLEYNPRYAKAYYRRARAHEATKDMSECLDDVTATFSFVFVIYKLQCKYMYV